MPHHHPPRRDRTWPATAVLAGLVAGSVAAAAQLALWWLTSVPLLATLLRDARLTAAIAMGVSVLAPVPAWRGDVWLLATLIHFALSIAYAVPVSLLAGRQRAGVELLAGAGYGALIYGVNLYGFTTLFPWFSASRGGVTLLTHLVFGSVLVGVCRWCARHSGPAA
ncbi:hypothetical protein [Pseudogulbenkiania ferrooxidans]|uniref:Sodium:proline symporter n=1 Tax=Pseudogulbenkiania ferrooxidans 2002 TaxID=279714 RepID=B9Z1T5_9NEIS|nr:hypothetical protein [Pseudogulbenkiania ferrooxidans]EEG09380.1 conserved hypothetical protein [Pseudogulbenkiania ferrooxidans 2002]